MMVKEHQLLEEFSQLEIQPKEERLVVLAQLSVKPDLYVQIAEGQKEDEECKELREDMEKKERLGFELTKDGIFKFKNI